jgi:hypothetical protein
VTSPFCDLVGFTAVAEPHHAEPASATLRVPSLGALWLRYEGDRGT